MKREISAGAVIFRRGHDGKMRFLLLFHDRGYWNFPKGRIESGEHAMTTFLREVEEETGLRRNELKIISGFRVTERYTFFAPPRLPHEPRGSGKPQPIFKIVTFYLVESRRHDVRISWEHEGIGWFAYPEAVHIAKFKNTKDILKQAHEFIERNLRRREAHPSGSRGHLRRHQPGHRSSPGLAPRRERPQP